MKDFQTTLDSLYEGKLKSVEELQHEVQQRLSEQEQQRVDWEKTKNLPACKKKLEQLGLDVSDALLSLESAAIDGTFSDSQVRLLVVRYSTLKRAFNKINNNEE